ncbi:MAG: hypothetical protein R2856_03280 [Caldilineaceae bacterium]
MATTPSTLKSQSPSIPCWRRYKPDQQWEAYQFLLPSFAGFFLFVALPVICGAGVELLRLEPAHTAPIRGDQELQ